MDREQQTLDIAAAVFGDATAWLVVAGVTAVGLATVSDLDSGAAFIPPFAFAGYVVTVVRRLLTAPRRRTQPDGPRRQAS
ncbi:hypothetical protein JCM18899A_26990 [Nocardioides sp. AN3]